MSGPRSQGPSVRAIPALSDNYVWLFVVGPGEAAVVDPGDAGPVVEILEREGLRLRHVLLTHHHFDHVAGTDALRARYGAEVLGAAHDAHRLPALDRALVPGEPLSVGAWDVRVLDVPGHTRGHIAYAVADALFAGDTLFSFGCGRLFEGTADEMWSSLCALRDLPGSTRVFCGHEYTESNLRFARHLAPGDPALVAVAAEAAALRQAGQPTLPAPLDRERRLNPFLRCDDDDFVRALGLSGRSAAEVFGVVRSRKDAF